MSWLRQKMIVLSMMMLLLVQLPSIMAGNQTEKNSECEFSDIESRLSIACEMIETAKQKLPKDLREYCKNLVGNEPNICNCNDTKVVECNETKIAECNETKIVECNETKKVECNETKIVECNYTKTFDFNECENTTCYVKPLDCFDIYLNGERNNGIYHVWPQNRMSTGRLQVYCDMQPLGGGWTVIQRRGDYGNSQDYFFRKWDAYKTGFGDMLKEFWIGNDNMFALTSRRQYQLIVHLRTWEGEEAYAAYDEFSISDENTNYTLHVKGYIGTAGDSLKYHDGMKFSTSDRDNDLSPSTSCAVHHKGAWWYNNCFHANLNGMYLRGDDFRGVVWSTFKGNNYSLKDVVMMIRPVGISDVRNRM